MNGTPPRPHRCPGCTSRDIAWPRLVCTACWRRLPDVLQQALLAHPEPGSDGVAWLAAVGNTLDWIAVDRATRLAGIPSRGRTTRRAA